MNEPAISVVTGASGYTGKYITRRLLARGDRVRNLTGHPDRPHPFGDAVESLPFDFDNPDKLREHLNGATTLYNTYWIRFARGETTFDRTLRNSLALLDAARQAGVTRVVHISIANPSADSPLDYYRGKAAVEKAVVESGMSYGIVRPTVVFGAEGILINNIAWFLRKLPVYGVPTGRGCRLQPVFVEDLADLAVDAGARTENLVTDAVGPEVFTLGELTRLIAKTVKSWSVILPAPAPIALGVSRIIGWLVGDVVLTRDELAGLRAGLLVSKGEPTTSTKLSEWLAEHADELGREYQSELARHYR